jgi:hypothetical protein
VRSDQGSERRLSLGSVKLTKFVRVVWMKDGSGKGFSRRDPMTTGRPAQPAHRLKSMLLI